MNINNQIIIIRNEILSGTFDSDGYSHCKFIFENCKFVNFDFDSSQNAVELLEGNVFYENIKWNPSQIKIKKDINCTNLETISISANKVEIEPNLQIRSNNGISIYANDLQLKEIKLSSSIIDIQSTYGITTLKNCKILTEQGCKITNTQGGLELTNCKIKNKNANLKDDGKKINGVIIQCFYQNGILKMDKTKIGTNLLEIYHPNKVYINDVSILKEHENGRLSLHGNKTICYNYIESNLELSKFLKTTIEKRTTEHTSKIKQLLKLIS